ncbi:alpha/beta fold hydrolase (plasmid) [Caballeronia sp. NK8]|uniref:alpha/beta hydrolase n=1 Tax=Burkholderiaceae TaxID=119060 RepID=UPI0013898C5E|nr:MULTISPECIES: alpha/beta hydrolase [Burkholderiaceae]BCQ28311.1 alpha/beta fold hydrolase [Caballeronia sp. NK8]
MRALARRGFISLTLAACVAGVFTSRARENDEERADGVAYGEAPRQRLDVYAPESRTGADRPVVVYFYGGGWQSGHRSDARGVAQALAAHGILTITPDYRIYPDAVFPGFLDDPAAAVRWARDHAREFGGDPKRIFVMGHSSGAHIAAMLATDPRYLAAQGMAKSSLAGMIGLAGPYAAIPTSDPHMDVIFPAALRQQALPIQFLSGNEPPMLLAAGTADTDVDPRNSDRFAAALRAHHDVVELKRYAGFGHDTIVKSLAATQGTPSPVLADVTAFIAAH